MERMLGKWFDFWVLVRFFGGINERITFQPTCRGFYWNFESSDIYK
jgi:hypothetical protein